MRRHRIEIASALLIASAGSAAADQKVTEVFFRFDSAELTRQATEKLDSAAKQLEDEPATRIVIDAHADPRGTAPYNVGLSIRRAESVRDHLLAKGVDKDNIVLAYYGEDGPRRETFAEDRRVGIALTNDPLYVVVDRALPDATALTWERPATTAEIDGPPSPEATARR